ncbi:MAG: ROK family transcriptional regulator [Firmicutes bacterium]|nr:ROK family transcriptional regulator [Bacillota bacterium]
MKSRPVTGNAQLSQQINRAIVLEAIREFQPISRAGIAKRTRLARPTVSRLVDSLITAQLVTEVGQGEASSMGGRRPTLVVFNASSFHVVGVELGISETFAVITDLEARVISDMKLPTVSDSRESTIKSLFDVIRQVVAKSKIPPEKIIGIGLGIHGQTDIDTGAVHFAPHLRGWEDVPIGSILEAEFGMPCLVENDIRAETIAELRSGAAKGKRNVVGLHVGSGIGAGIIIDGHVYRGADKSAGEIGHIAVVDDGPLCRCGKRGCLETVAAGPAIVTEAIRTVRSQPGSVLAGLAGGDINHVTVDLVLEAAMQGDPAALSIMDRSGRYIGAAIATTINLFNPEMVVLLGSVSRKGSLLLEPIRTAAMERSLKVPARNVDIVLGELGEFGGAIGAAVLILEQRQKRLDLLLVESLGVAQG